MFFRSSSHALLFFGLFSLLSAPVLSGPMLAQSATSPLPMYEGGKGKKTDPPPRPKPKPGPRDGGDDD